MAVVEELLRSESNGTISFGNHQLAQKAKKEDYEHEGDVYKVKTFQAMTKLEKNGLFLYESVPGTSVLSFAEKADVISFTMKTNLSGKLNLSVELEGVGEVEVKLEKQA